MNTALDSLAQAPVRSRQVKSKLDPPQNGTKKEIHGGIVDPDGAKIQTHNGSPQWIWGRWNPFTTVNESRGAEGHASQSSSLMESWEVPLLLDPGLDSPLPAKYVLEPPQQMCSSLRVCVGVRSKESPKKCPPPQSPIPPLNAMTLLVSVGKEVPKCLILRPKHEIQTFHAPSGPTKGSNLHNEKKQSGPARQTQGFTHAMQ